MAYTINITATNYVVTTSFTVTNITVTATASPTFTITNSIVNITSTATIENVELYTNATLIRVDDFSNYYKGDWDSGTTYIRGDIVNYQYSLYVSNIATATSYVSTLPPPEDIGSVGVEDSVGNWSSSTVSKPNYPVPNWRRVVWNEADRAYLTIGDYLEVGGLASFYDNVGIDGDLQTAGQITTNRMTIGESFAPGPEDGGLEVSGNSVFRGSVDFQGDISVTNNALVVAQINTHKIGGYIGNIYDPYINPQYTLLELIAPLQTNGNNIYFGSVSSATIAQTYEVFPVIYSDVPSYSYTATVFTVYDYERAGGGLPLVGGYLKSLIVTPPTTTVLRQVDGNEGDRNYIVDVTYLGPTTINGLEGGGFLYNITFARTLQFSPAPNIVNRSTLYASTDYPNGPAFQISQYGELPVDNPGGLTMYAKEFSSTSTSTFFSFNQDGFLTNKNVTVKNLLDVTEGRTSLSTTTIYGKLTVNNSITNTTEVSLHGGMIASNHYDYGNVVDIGSTIPATVYIGDSSEAVFLHGEVIITNPQYPGGKLPYLLGASNSSTPVVSIMDVNDITGFTGSRGFTGSQGYNGSRGYNGSAGLGYSGLTAVNTGTVSLPALVTFNQASINPAETAFKAGDFISVSFAGNPVAYGYINSFANTSSLVVNFTSPGTIIGGSYPFSLAGTTGFSGSQGYSGSAGFSGSIGVGYTGSRGNAGVSDKFKTSSITAYTLGAVNTTGTIFVNTGLSWTIAQDCIIAADIDHFVRAQVIDYNEATGEFIFRVTSKVGSGTYSAWTVNLDGAAGVLGYTGSQGDTGFIGSQGYDGSLGYTGSLGFTGSQGDIGYVGSQGNTGYVGSLGFTGSTGFTGSQGYDGSRGDTGFIGSKGDLGYTGSTGFTGSQGDIGYTGSQGYNGSQGNLGFVGSQGFIGSQGYNGSQGDLGYTGSRGQGYNTLRSVSTVTAATGYQNFLVDYNSTSTAYQAGQFVTIINTSSFTFMYGIITAYSGNTLYTNVVYVNGYGTYSDWTIGLSGAPGEAGYTGSIGIGYTGSQGLGYPALTTSTLTSFIFPPSPAGTTKTFTILDQTLSNTAYRVGDIVKLEGTNFAGSWLLYGTVETISGNSLPILISSVELFGDTTNPNLSISWTIGLSGARGLTGYTGSKGFTGSVGFTGSIGVGYTGSSGTPGAYTLPASDGSAGQVLQTNGSGTVSWSNTFNFGTITSPT